jgi:hypothetical protein
LAILSGQRCLFSGIVADGAARSKMSINVWTVCRDHTGGVFFAQRTAQLLSDKLKEILTVFKNVFKRIHFEHMA